MQLILTLPFPSGLPRQLIRADIKVIFKSAACSGSAGNRAARARPVSSAGILQRALCKSLEMVAR
jgi:hypothetical protein